MREDVKCAIEQGLNFSARYRDNLTVSMMVRQAICFLPKAIRTFEKEQPGVQVTPLFQYDNGPKAQVSSLPVFRAVTCLLSNPPIRHQSIPVFSMASI